MTTQSSSGTYRLLSNVIPTHYALAIKTDLEKLVFEGSIVIESVLTVNLVLDHLKCVFFYFISLDIKTKTSQLVVNVADLEIVSASIYSEIFQPGHVHLTPVVDATLERVTFDLERTLPAASKAQLKILFKAKLSSVIGYFRSSWDDNGTRRSYALTHFEVL
jgi:aminopeptidase 2